MIVVVDELVDEGGEWGDAGEEGEATCGEKGLHGEVGIGLGEDAGI